MKKHINEAIQFGAGFEHYFFPHHNETNGMFQFPEDRTDVIERENNLSGYFCIITSENMTAKTLEQQIEKMQEKVIHTKSAYDNAVESLQKRLDKRDAKRKEDLWNVVIKSNESYEEILQMIANGAMEEN